MSMRTLGILLLGVGFLSCAFVTVRTVDSREAGWESISWAAYVPTFLVGAAGVVLLRLSAHSVSTQTHKISADLKAMDGSIAAIRERLDKMCGEGETLDVFDVHDRIDDDLVQPLGVFVEARETLSRVYGMQAYADIMSKFALGERNINRAWSASVDGYIDEVRTCLDNARHLMDEVHDMLRQRAAEKPTA